MWLSSVPIGMGLGRGGALATPNFREFYFYALG
jgi:hypothetical protein